MRKLVPRRRGTQQSFLRGGAAQRFNPYPFIYHFCQKRYLLQLNFFISGNFCFSFVSNSLAYITVSKNNGKVKLSTTKPSLTNGTPFTLT